MFNRYVSEVSPLAPEFTKGHIDFLFGDFQGGWSDWLFYLCGHGM